MISRMKACRCLTQDISDLVDAKLSEEKMRKAEEIKACYWSRL